MTRPYYQDDLVTLYHGDCREITDWLEADVLVFDPPYGRNWQQGSRLKNSQGYGRSRANAGIANDTDTRIRDGVLSMWTGGRAAAVFGDPLIDRPADTVQVLFYGKPDDAGVKGARAGFRRDVEHIYLVGPWPVGVGGRSSILRTNAHVAGPRALSIRHGHPHAKPVDVMQELIAACPPGVIADPTAGAGSTLVAAKYEGRRAIGVELVEEHCERAAIRLAAPTLFGAVS